MKEVIKNNNEVVLNNEVSEKKYYGVDTLEKNKGFILQRNYCQGEFYAICENSLTYGNSFGWRGNSLKEVVEDILSSKNAVVYEFNTPQELFKWLSE